MQKIIWNITKKCGFHCDICATQSDGKRELSYEEKRQILLEICSLKEKIMELDFAGGDPLFDKESKKIIGEAINKLGRENISVTTTGIGINQLNIEEKKQYLYKCELSLDDIENCDAKIRKESSYSIKNLEAIHHNKKYIHDLTINIPIFETEKRIDSLKNLISIINEIDIENLSVNILRYMPVGRVKLCDYPKLYSPEEDIDYIKKNMRKDIRVHIHCAMRGIEGGNDNCSMLLKKFGIDCEGNIFMCAWAGYLKVSIEKNPFYLGNVLEQGFESLFKTEKVTEMRKNLKNIHRGCCIFSYLCSDSHDMFSNQDPLFKEG